MPPLTPLALENAPLLRRLQARDFDGKTALAKALGRDLPNLNKTLKRLEGEGLVAGVALTDQGANAVRALDQLDAGEGAATVVLPTSTVGEISLDLIDTDPLLNPRTVFAEEPLQALAESIRDKGVAQPILLRPGLEPGRYRVVAGERRTRASRLAGMTAIPAIIRDLDDDQALEIATIENIQREDLSPLEEANAFSRIVEAKLRIHPDLSLKDAKEIIADAVRKTVRYVEQRMDLLELSKAEQARVALPKDDHKHLSLESARWRVQEIRREKRQAAERTLEPEDLLVVAELADKMQKAPAELRNWWSSGGKPTEVAYDLPGDVRFEALRKRRIISFYEDRNDDGRSHASLGEGFTKKDLVRQLPAFAGARRAQALADLRFKLKERAVLEPGRYSTWWLNGPFKIDPSKADAVKRKEAAAKATETKRANAAAKAEEILNAADGVVRSLAVREPAIAHDGFVSLLAQCDRPTPWRMSPEGNVYAANGKTIISDRYYHHERSPELLAQRMLLIAAVNLASGAAFAVEPDREAEIPAEAAA